MKKILLILMVLLFTGALLAACNDNGNDGGAAGEESETPDEIEEMDTDETESDAEDNEETSVEENNKDSASGSFEVTEEDQLDLRINDTGLYQTSLGTYELTVDSAEIVGEELDGEYRSEE